MLEAKLRAEKQFDENMKALRSEYSGLIQEYLLSLGADYLLAWSGRGG